MAIAIVTQLPPSVRDATSAQATGTNPVVVNKPVGTVDGDMVIAIQTMHSSGDPNTMQPPDDSWQQRGSTGGSASVGWMKIWWKDANGEPTSWSFAKGADGTVSVLAITRHDFRDPWDVEPVFGTGSATTSHVAPTITTFTDQALEICAFASESGGTTHSTPGGMTEQEDVTVAAGNGHSVCTETRATAGSTGTRTATASAAQDYVTVSFAIASPPNKASTTYAPSITLPHYSAADNTLVVLVGANSTGAHGSSSCQVSSIVDDANNTWVPGPTAFATAGAGDPYTSSRVAIWYCAGAKPIRKLTVTMTEIVDSLAIDVVEASGLTNVNVVDISGSNSSASTSGLTASGTTTNASDLIIAAATVGDSGITLNHTADTWTTLPNNDTASTVTAKDDVRLRGAYKILAATGAQSTAWTLSPSGAGAWALLALKGGSIVTTNPNPNWPQIVHELGFGSDPNNPTTAISWTTVTNRVTAFATQRGRDYELARTEAGEANVSVRNFDGAFDPNNAGSPYSPNVRVITPYRVRATWDGKVYSLFSGYVERWPQRWDNQYGSSRMQVVDGLATLSGTRLAGALGAEILADGPHAYWPLDDGRLASQAANKATTTTTPLSAAESINKGGSSGFGATLALQSEESTCWDQTRLSTTPTSDAPSAIYGTCLTAGMALPQLASGVLIECWAKIPAATPQQNYTLLALKADTFSSNAERRVAVLQLDSTSGLPVMYVSDSAGTLASFSASASGFNDGGWHHYVVHLTTTTVKLWVDGALRVDGTLSSVPAATIDRISVGGEVDTWTNQNIAVGSFAHVAVFQLSSVDTRRIAARANAGLFGFPERSGARISRLLNYAGWAGGRAIDDGLAFLGAAATIAKQTLLAAVQDVASWENGLVFVDAAGNFRFVDRATRFAQATKYVFGDGTGEIPYETDVEIDFDPKYVFNDVTITKSSSRTVTGQTIGGGSSAHKKDQASIAAYFTRTLDKTSGVSSISQCEAEATWTLENYAQPRARLARISFVPSANPALWPVALGIEIGDRVTVIRRPFGGGATITLDCYVEQVGHSVQPNEWRVTLSLSPVLLTTYGAQNEWILNASALDVDTIVGA